MITRCVVETEYELTQRFDVNSDSLVVGRRFGDIGERRVPIYVPYYVLTLSLSA